MTLKRRTFIKSAGIGAASLVTGILPSSVSGSDNSTFSLSAKPLPLEKISYWHGHMIGYLEENGILNQTPVVPEEPAWRIVEKGRIPQTLPMPYPHVLAKDVRHIKEDISHCSYSYGVVDTSFGNLRVDHFLKDTFNMAKSVYINSGSFAVITLNGQHLGYAGYTSRPKDYSLNFEGLPLGGRVLKVWTPIKADLHFKFHIYYLWERA